ncbi:MAG: hypothetical protein MJZ34_11095 [Paludibacteraceae bacterium]|nr:hypothetical protein [Paludibacteraceae bacterium]
MKKVLLTESEYRKVCSVLNEQSAKASMEANPTEEDVEMYGELLDVKIQKDRPRMRGMKTHYVISSYYGDEEPTQIMVRNDDSMYVFPNGGDIPTVKDLWNIIKDYSDNYVEIEN